MQRGTSASKRNAKRNVDISKHRQGGRRRQTPFSRPPVPTTAPAPRGLRARSEGYGRLMPRSFFATASGRGAGASATAADNVGGCMLGLLFNPFDSRRQRFTGARGTSRFSTCVGFVLGVRAAEDLRSRLTRPGCPDVGGSGNHHHHHLLRVAPQIRATSSG